MKDSLKKTIKKIPGVMAIKNAVSPAPSLRGAELDNKYQKLQEDYNRLQYSVKTLEKLHEDIVMRRWEKDEHLQEFTCISPYEYFDIYSEGDAYCCCSAFVKYGYSLGNLYEKSFEEIWNSEHARKLRYCASNGDFEYCHDICATLHSKPEDDMNMLGLPPLQYRNQTPYNFERWEDCVVSRGPKYVKLECDVSCNLSCPSCRSSIKILDEAQSDRVYNMLVEKILPNLNDCELLTSLASGELLASKALMRFYKLLSAEKFPKMSLMIYSNGMLLDETHWNELSNLNGMPITFAVSVDAAEKETYEELRRGGKWDRLNKNLLWVKSLTEANPNIKLRLNFCVQTKNYLQIPKFMEFAKKVGASFVAFQYLTDWGTVSYEEYVQNNVFHPDNALRPEAEKLLKAAMNTEGISVLTNIL